MGGTIFSRFFMNCIEFPKNEVCGILKKVATKSVPHYMKAPIECLSCFYSAFQVPDNEPNSCYAEMCA